MKQKTIHWQWYDPETNILYTTKKVKEITNCVTTTAINRIKKRIAGKITTEQMLQIGHIYSSSFIHPATKTLYTADELHKITGFSLTYCYKLLAKCKKGQYDIDNLIKSRKNKSYKNTVFYTHKETEKKYIASDILKIKNCSYKQALRYIQYANKGKINYEQLISTEQIFLIKKRNSSKKMRILDQALTPEKQLQIKKDLKKFKKLGDQIEEQEKRWQNNIYKKNNF